MYVSCKCIQPSLQQPQVEVENYDYWTTQKCGLKPGPENILFLFLQDLFAQKAQYKAVYGN